MLSAAKSASGGRGRGGPRVSTDQPIAPRWVGPASHRSTTRASLLLAFVPHSAERTSRPIQNRWGHDQAVVEEHTTRRAARVLQRLQSAHNEAVVQPNHKSKPHRHRYNHPVGHTDHEEPEPHAIPIVGAQFLSMLLPERRRVPAITTNTITTWIAPRASINRTLTCRMTLANDCGSLPLQPLVTASRIGRASSAR